MLKITRLIVLLIGVVALFFLDTSAVADPTMSTIATAIGGSVRSLGKILQDISLIAGIGFIMASFFKFHQHKLNPTQVPMSQGITLLLIGAGLAVFPHLFGTATQAVFGTKIKMATLGGNPFPT